VFLARYKNASRNAVFLLYYLTHIPLVCLGSLPTLFSATLHAVLCAAYYLGGCPTDRFNFPAEYKSYDIVLFAVEREENMGKGCEGTKELRCTQGRVKARGASV
jgi:hypothetical protein